MLLIQLLIKNEVRNEKLKNLRKNRECREGLREFNLKKLLTPC